MRRFKVKKISKSNYSQKIGIILLKTKNSFFKAWTVIYEKFQKINGKYLFLSLSVCIVVIGSFLFYRFSHNNSSKTKSDENNVVTYSSDDPDEKPPDKNYKWIGKYDDPKKIKISSIGVDAFIQKIGVDQNSQMAVPNNVHFAGWFVDTVKPGDLGLSIIDGHLNGTSIGGIFRKLNELKVGETFQIELGDKTIRQFKVRDVLIVDTSSSAEVLYSQYPFIERQLNLITCGGTFDKVSKLYDKRVIVISEYIEE